VIAAQRQRTAILRQLGDQRGVSGARMLVVGLPAGAADAKAADESADSATAAAKSRPTSLETPVDQHAIFARTLLELLTNSRLRLDTLTAESGPPPGKIADKLSSYDCIVVVGNQGGLDLTALDPKNGPLVIDARDHTFVPAAGQKTAWQRDPGGVSAIYTGVVPIGYKAQRMLLDSLVQSTFWSVITITPLLMWIARSFTAGSVAMLPNVLPIVMVFGGMGWLGIDVDVGSMMTASIALGVAVDDTIHYLNWFREELDRLGDRKKAILAAYRHCATPTLQAAVISGLGLSVFAISTFTPTQRFGILMLVILWLGAVAELIYFPALLAGPLGMVFKPRKKPGSEHGEFHEDSPAGQTQPHQHQIVHHDDSGDEVSPDEEQLVPAAADSGAKLRPASAKSGQPRRLRPDTPHRR
jgi:hypothetical protein